MPAVQLFDRTASSTADKSVPVSNIIARDQRVGYPLGGRADRHLHSGLLLALCFVPIGILGLHRGAVYARFSTKYQHSTADQVRKCLEWAEQNGVQVRPEHIFVDEGVTGRSSRRKGLKGLQEALARNEVDVVLALATNRLYRKAYKAAQFVEEEVVDRGRRAVFLDTNIDTAEEGRWRQYFQMHSMLDEFTATSTVAHIRAAQEGLFQAGRVFGSLTFGYTGHEIPGVKTRNGRPARRIVIDRVASEWVRKVFDWFVEDRLGMRTIAHRLNSEGAPASPRGTGHWSSLAVRHLLGNERYTGRWAYGKTRAQWNNARSYTRQVRRDRPLKEQAFEDLRIIEDVTFRKAQELLAANRHHVAGRRPRDTTRQRPRVLNGLLYCARHDRPLLVGASYGSGMYCPACRKEPQPALYSLLHRDRAVRCICRTVADLLRRDEDLIDQVIAACQRHVESAGRPDPADIEALRRKEASLTGRIRFLMDTLGDTETDRAESRAKLQDIRRERATVQTQLAEMQAASRRPVAVPSPEEVRQLVDRTAEVLLQAVGSEDPAEWGAARRVLEAVTGGRITVTQQGEAKAKRGWLRGTFRVRALKLLAGQVGCECGDDAGVEVRVDFRDPPAEAAIADRVKALCDRGLLYKEVAGRMALPRSAVVRALKYWHASRNLPMPDGRRRRFEIEKQAADVHKYRGVAREALHLYDQGWLLKDIAGQLDCDRTTVTKAVSHALRHSGLAPVDGRTRRKSLPRQIAAEQGSAS